MERICGGINVKQKKNLVPFVLFVVSSLFYLLFYLYDGIILTEDANSYIMMETNREPGYCIFLWIIRYLFGTDIYLHIAVIVQCIIAGAAATAITVSLTRRFSLHVMTATGILAIQYAITLLNRFVAQRRYSYYNSIETEALSYSLWIFFMIAIMNVIYEKRRRDIVAAFIWSLLLMSIRKQMYITLGVLFFAIIYVLWKKDKKVKVIVVSLLIIFVCLLSNNLIDRTYNFAMRGVFEEHTGDASFIFGTEVYMAEESYADYISDEEMRKLFLQILKQSKKKEYNKIYAPDVFLGLEDHYSLSYDRIKFDIVNVIIREYEDEIGIHEDEREQFSSELIGEMVKELFLPSINSMIKLFLQNVIHGLIITVALKRNVITSFGAIGIYTAYIFLAYLIFKRKKNYITNSVIPIAVITLLAILGNIGLTSATIYCQARYMLYNTALFYQIGLIMLAECISYIRKKQK